MKIPHLCSALAIPAILAMLATTTALSASQDQRADVGRYILEKLGSEQGDLWQESGRYFFWEQRLDGGNGCDLEIRRRDFDGQRTIEQHIPLTDTVPVWLGESTLRFYCAKTTDCIELKVQDRGSQSRRRVGQTRIAVMDSSDLPKLRDAFTELHRLCDSPYSGAR